MPPFTIVTAIYDLKKRESQVGIERLKDISFYLNKGKDLLNLNMNMIIFCDAELHDSIKSIQRPEGTLTEIRKLDLEQLDLYQDLDKVRDLRSKGSFFTGNPNKDTPLFMIVQWSKFDLLSRAKSLLENELKWKSNHLLWVDFGLSYVAKDIHKIKEFKPTENFKLLCLRPTYLPEINDWNFFRYAQGRTGGGIFMIPIDKLDLYVNLFRETKDMFISKGITPLEDEILTYIRVKNPELFDLYYGDYEDIVRNFNDECWSQLGILQIGCSSCINFNDLDTLERILERVYRNRTYYLESKVISTQDLRNLINLYLSVLFQKGTKENLINEVIVFLSTLGAA